MWRRTAAAQLAAEFQPDRPPHVTFSTPKPSTLTALNDSSFAAPAELSPVTVYLRIIFQPLYPGFRARLRYTPGLPANHPRHHAVPRAHDLVRAHCDLSSQHNWRFYN